MKGSACLHRVQQVHIDRPNLDVAASKVPQTCLKRLSPANKIHRCLSARFFGKPVDPCWLPKLDKVALGIGELGKTSIRVLFLIDMLRDFSLLYVSATVSQPDQD